MSFNGTDTYVQMGENLPDLHNNARTLVFWAKATNWTAGQQVIIESDAFEMTVVIGYPNSNPQYISFTTDVATNNNQRRTWDASGLTNDTWHHFAMTVDSSNNISDIYVDGAPETASTIAGFGQSTGINNIGKRFTNQQYFNGELDEIAVFNSELSSCDIKGIYEATTIVAGQPKSANLLDPNTTIPAPIYWNRMGDS